MRTKKNMETAGAVIQQMILSGPYLRNAARTRQDPPDMVNGFDSHLARVLDVARNAASFIAHKARYAEHLYILQKNI
jgi:hypothetical protein